MGTTSIPPATDDWPFVYLPRPSFPDLYLRGLALIAAISLAGIWLIAPRNVLRRFDWHMLFLAAAFALLEVKAPFRDRETAGISFASNLLGIMTGGMLEYLSMLFGYRALLWLLIAFYALAIVLRGAAISVSSR